ncbi:MAG TPA: glycosyltransferase family 2 protein [Solirubrobacteraceae bacterium]|jgi:GT2 family glycosyltransferase|nr:glycosyltransferase family 2 protein [Solirubrobacteraceae bacterium]
MNGLGTKSKGNTPAGRPLNGRSPAAGDSRPDLSAIVVTHNRTELALATLASARAAADGVAVQWLVVDSGSSDDTPEAIERRFPDVQLLRAANVGFAAANNLALALARGRYVLLLNPDVEIASGTFAELIALLDARPRVGVASVIQRGGEGELQYSIRRYPSPLRAFGEALAPGGLPGLRRWGEEERNAARYREERSADWLVGAFLIARAEVVAQIGGLDERFFLYSEETDWCYRARAAGWDVRHLPQMAVVHHNTPTARPDLVAQLSYAKLLFARKHYRRVRAAAIRAALALRHGMRAQRRAFAVVTGFAPPPFE